MKIKMQVSYQQATRNKQRNSNRVTGHFRRQKCNCMAQRHKLINNCLSCGRIVCELEGEGPCFFCGNLVVGKNSQKVYEEDLEFFTQLDSDESLMKSYFKAMENRDKLLQFEKQRVAQKNIIDEEADLYEIKDDVWQDSVVREEASKRIQKREGEQDVEEERIVVEFDAKTKKFVDRKVKVRTDREKRAEIQEFMAKIERFEREKREGEGLIEEARLESEEVRKVVNAVKKNYRAQAKGLDRRERVIEKRPWEKKLQHEDDYENFDEMLTEQQKKKKRQAEEAQKGYDKEIYDINKNYVPRCLTLWQPWASLMVHGIKRFEGRKWNSGYRGPLWIHAATTEPKPEDIKEVERFYKENWQREQNERSHSKQNSTQSQRRQIKFPKRYPTGCLVGVVDIQDVWTAEQYEQRLPSHLEKESIGAFVMVSRNPRILQIPIRCGGSKGIYEIPKERVRKAMKLLRKPKTDYLGYFADGFLGERKKEGFYEIRYVDVEGKMREDEEEFDPVVKKLWEKKKQPEMIKEEEEKKENGEFAENLKVGDGQKTEVGNEEDENPGVEFSLKFAKKKKKKRKRRNRKTSHNSDRKDSMKEPTENIKMTAKTKITEPPQKAEKNQNEETQSTLNNTSFEKLITSEKNFSNGRLLQIANDEIAQIANKLLSTLKKSLKTGLENKKSFSIDFAQSPKLKNFISYLITKNFSSTESGEFQNLSELLQKIRFDAIKYKDGRKWRRADKRYQLVFAWGKGVKLTDESRSAFVDIPDNHMFVARQEAVEEFFLFKQYKSKGKKGVSYLENSGDFDSFLMCFYFLG